MQIDEIMHSRMGKKGQRRARSEGKPEDGSIIYKICRSCGMCAKSDMDMRGKNRCNDRDRCMDIKISARQS